MRLELGAGPRGRAPVAPVGGGGHAPGVQVRRHGDVGVAPGARGVVDAGAGDARVVGARHGAADNRPVLPDAEVAPGALARACGRPPRAARRRPRAARARRRRPPRRRRGPPTSRRARPASPPERPCRHLPSGGPACRYRTARGTRPNQARGVLATISVEEPLFSRFAHFSRLERFRTGSFLPTAALSEGLSDTATFAVWDIATGAVSDMWPFANWGFVGSLVRNCYARRLRAADRCVYGQVAFCHLRFYGPLCRKLLRSRRGGWGRACVLGLGWGSGVLGLFGLGCGSGRPETKVASVAEI